ncbi:MAG TPA: hypothetical protein VF618_13175 [Thermoanaerobaculia bacterium]
MRKLVASIILLLAAGAAYAQEIRFGQPPIGLAPGRRDGIVVAASRSTYLAIWRDERISPADPRLWASRVTASGIGVDGTGFNITALEQDSDYAVVSEGSNFLVAWTEQHSRVRIVRISAAGEIAPVTTIHVPVDDVALSFNGEQIFLAASRTTGGPFGGGQIHVLLLDREGNALMQPVSLIESIFALAEVEAVLVNGRFRLQWFDDKFGGLRSHMLEPAKLLDGTATRLVVHGSAPEVRPQVLFETVGRDGTPDYYIARVIHNNGKNVVRGIYHDGSSQYSTFTQQLVNDESDNLPYVRPAAAWNGEAFVTAWGAPAGGAGGVRVKFTKPGGSATAKVHELPGGEATSIAVTSVGSTTFVASTRDYPTGTVVEAELLANDETSRTRFVLSAGLPKQALPVAVWRGNHHLLVWREIFGDGARLVTGRLAPEDPTVVRGGNVGPLNVTSDPSIATDGTQALIAFNAGGRLQTVLLDADQNVLETKDLAPAGTTAPTAIWSGSNYVVTWGTPQGISAMRVGLDTQPVVLSTMTTNAAPIVLRHQDRLLFAWNDNEALRGLVRTKALVPQGETLTLVRGKFSAPRGAEGANEVAIAAIEEGILHVVRWSLAGVHVLSAAVDARTTEISGVVARGDGYLVGAGAYTFDVTGAEISKARVTYPFVPPGMPATLLAGAPKTLVVWKRPPQSITEQRMQMVARYALESPRRRGVR